MRLTAVTFDAVGTLLAPREAVGVTYARIAAAYGLAFTPETAEARFRRAFAAARPLARLVARGGTAEVVRRERAWWADVLRRVFAPEAHGPTLDELVEACWSHYAAPEAWAVYREVGRVLAELRRRGVRLAIVSNADQRLARVLDALGLADAVDVVSLPSRTGAVKPDPAMFGATLRELGVTAAEALHVGDSVREDVEGARAAGMRAVWLDRHDACRRSPPGVACVGSLATLPPLVLGSGGRERWLSRKRR